MMVQQDIGASITPLLEDYERSTVPPEQWRGYGSLTLVFVGVCIGIPPLLLGSVLVTGLGMAKATTAILWSSVIAAPICLLAAQVGTRARLSTAMTLKCAFGTVGANLISAIIAIDTFCWFAVNTEIFGDSVQSTVKTVTGFHLSQPALIITAGFLITLVTVFGYRSLERLASWSVPLLSVVLVTYFAFSLIGTSIRTVMQSPPSGKRIEYTTAISIVAGSYLNLSVLLPDYTRYAKNSWHAATAVLVGLCVGLPVVVLIAGYLTAATGEVDFVKLMLIKGWGLAAIFVIAVTCWIHMNSCLYSSSLNLAAIACSVPKWKFTAAAGFAGTAVALVGLVNRYVSFLTLLSIVVPPITGVFTADYLLFKKRYVSPSTCSPNRVRPLSLVSLALGIALGFVTSSQGWVDFGLFQFTRLPAIDAFLGSFLSHLILTRLWSWKEKHAAPAVTTSAGGDQIGC